MKLTLGTVISTLLISAPAWATTYHTPPANQAIIGQVQYNSANSGDNAITVAKRYDIGFNALQKANPHLDMTRGLPSSASLILPTQHLLPNQPREGIIINLPEMRMYYFVSGTNQVLTFPIGIGKIGKTIPIEKTSITKKTKDPVWVPTEDIRVFNLETNGIVLPQIMP